MRRRRKMRRRAAMLTGMRLRDERQNDPKADSLRCMSSNSRSGLGHHDRSLLF
jgi:hypothetical protein